MQDKKIMVVNRSARVITIGGYNLVPGEPIEIEEEILQNPRVQRLMEKKDIREIKTADTSDEDSSDAEEPTPKTGKAKLTKSKSKAASKQIADDAEANSGEGSPAEDTEKEAEQVKE